MMNDVCMIGKWIYLYGSWRVIWLYEVMKLFMDIISECKMIMITNNVCWNEINDDKMWHVMIMMCGGKTMRNVHVWIWTKMCMIKNGKTRICMVMYVDVCTINDEDEWNMMMMYLQVWTENEMNDVIYMDLKLGFYLCYDEMWCIY